MSQPKRTLLGRPPARTRGYAGVVEESRDRELPGAPSLFLIIVFILFFFFLILFRICSFNVASKQGKPGLLES